MTAGCHGHTKNGCTHESQYKSSWCLIIDARPPVCVQEGNACINIALAWQTTGRIDPRPTDALAVADGVGLR